MPRLPGKMAIARKIILQDPTISTDNILLKMKKMGIEKMPKGTLGMVRHQLRAEGHTLPHLQPGIPKGPVKLNSKIAVTMRMIYENPSLSAADIKKELIEKELAKKGLKHVRNIQNVRRNMQKYFSEIDFSAKRGRKPKPSHLTREQEAMIPAFKKVIGWALYKRILPPLRWPTERKREFEEFVGEQLSLLIKNYDKKRAKLSTYIVNKLGFLLKDYIRSTLMTEMGITQTEARLVIKIIREKSQGLQDNEKIAEKLGCKKQDVDELLQAYQDFLRISSRLGNREKER